MKEYRLLSWNVNGMRSVCKKGFLDWLETEKPDVLGVQETKARPEQLDQTVMNPEGYTTYWSFPGRMGYSGTALFTREQPQDVWYDFGERDLEMEGRVVAARYPGFIFFNIYYPNGASSQERLDYKMHFYDEFLDYMDSLVKKGEQLVICGDLNTAHNEIDIARPKENSKRSGFLPMEREWMDKFESHGYVDTFRYFHKEPDQYTYWDVKTRARERNVGWRIDYFYVNKGLLPAVKDAFILKDVMGSDHCPLGITLAVD